MENRGSLFFNAIGNLQQLARQVGNVKLKGEIEESIRYLITLYTSQRATYARFKGDDGIYHYELVSSNNFIPPEKEYLDGKDLSELIEDGVYVTVTVAA